MVNAHGVPDPLSPAHGCVTDRIAEIRARMDEVRPGWVCSASGIGHMLDDVRWLLPEYLRVALRPDTDRIASIRYALRWWGIHPPVFGGPTSMSRIEDLVADTRWLLRMVEVGRGSEDA